MLTRQQDRQKPEKRGGGVPQFSPRYVGKNSPKNWDRQRVMSPNYPWGPKKPNGRQGHRESQNRPHRPQRCPPLTLGAKLSHGFSVDFSTLGKFTTKKWACSSVLLGIVIPLRERCLPRFGQSAAGSSVVALGFESFWSFWGVVLNVDKNSPKNWDRQQVMRPNYP